MALKTPIINIMTKAAYKAGNILIKDFREVENLQVSKKGIGDFVTSSDLNSEKTIIKILEKAYPEIKVISEETNPETDLDNHEKKWIIDPLDGTLNFLHQLEAVLICKLECSLNHFKDCGFLIILIVCLPICPVEPIIDTFFFFIIFRSFYL